jgi:phosphatidylserine synthase
LNIPGAPDNFIYRNLANLTSILGVLPLVVLFLSDGYQYIVPLIIFNNIMDDLDGVLAAKLNIRSRFGADLDNICDAVAHVILALAVGAHFGSLLIAASAIAAGSIVLRVAIRLDPNTTEGTGSPTNELMRHMLFILLLAEQFEFGLEYILIAVFLINSVSMLVPYPMPGLIRKQVNTAAMIGLVNVALVAAWLVPIAAPMVAVPFLATYIHSFVLGWVGWQKTEVPKKVDPV